MIICGFFFNYQGKRLYCAARAEGVLLNCSPARATRTISRHVFHVDYRDDGNRQHSCRDTAIYYSLYADFVMRQYRPRF